MFEQLANLVTIRLAHGHRPRSHLEGPVHCLYSPQYEQNQQV